MNMEKEDWALLISLGSLGVAFASFMWNVWSKFIYPKPKIKVRLWLTEELLLGGPAKRLHVIDLSNHGPGRVMLERVIVQKRFGFLWRKRHTINIQPTLKANPWLLPFESGEEEFPRIVEVGEALSLYFDVSSPGGLRAYGWVGVLDTFGRVHWVSTGNLRAIQRSWESVATASANR